MLGQVITALVGFGSLVAAAPTAPKVAEAQSNNQTSFNVIKQISQISQISQFGQLAQFAEADLLSQIQSQILLAAELQTIKNNIRINTLRARYPQVNTVLVTVTNVIDARNPAGINNRYLLNQLVVDNGFPNQQQILMVTESQTYTITAASVPQPTDFSPPISFGGQPISFGAPTDLGNPNVLSTSSTQTDSSTSPAKSSPTTSSSATTSSATRAPTLDLASILASAATATPTASILSLPLINSKTFNLGLNGIGQPRVIQQQQTTVITSFNPLTGIPPSFLNSAQALLLPYDTSPPTSSLIIEDPANIIYGGVTGLLVESTSTLQADCAAFALGGNTFLGGATNLGLFSSLQQAVQFQLSSIQIGSATQVIPPSIILAHPGLVGGLRLVVNTTGTATETASSTSTNSETASATKH